MTVSTEPLVYDPYAYEIHEDPYPTYARLRDEAPVYRNEERGFWALSRHADVMAAFRDSDRFSNAQGVSIDPAASDPTPTAPCRSWPWIRRSTAACAAWSRGPSPPVGWPRWRTASGPSPCSTSNPPRHRDKPEPRTHRSAPPAGRRRYGG